MVIGAGLQASRVGVGHHLQGAWPGPGQDSNNSFYWLEKYYAAHRTGTDPPSNMPINPAGSPTTQGMVRGHGRVEHLGPPAPLSQAFPPASGVLQHQHEHQQRGGGGATR
ncbi:unnamed protein product, partial [Discosporangium mesarthrocarpum]